MHSPLLPTLAVLCLAAFQSARAQEQQPAAALRAGMIGLDTSHVPAFTAIFNGGKATGDVAGIKVVAGYPGGTDLPASRDRVANFTEQIRSKGVEIVDSIPKLLEKVDVVLLESVDGRIHLQEAMPVIKAGKPLWIDKPAAGSLADAIAIYEFAKKKNGADLFQLVAALRRNPDTQEQSGAGRRDGRSHVGAVLLLDRYSRSLLLRHPRRRASLCHHGHLAVRQ
jgi:hypothetical protein